MRCRRAHLLKELAEQQRMNVAFDQTLAVEQDIGTTDCSFEILTHVREHIAVETSIAAERHDDRRTVDSHTRSKLIICGSVARGQFLLLAPS